MESIFGRSTARFSLASGRLTRRRYSEDDAAILRTHRQQSLPSNSRSPTGPRQKLPINHGGGELTPPRTSRFASSAGIAQDYRAPNVLPNPFDLQRKVYALRDRVSQARFRYSHEQEKFSDLLKSHLQSTQELMAFFDKAVKLHTLVDSNPRLSELRKKCGQSQLEVEVQQYVNRHTSIELSSLESSLLRKEQELDAALTTLCHTLGLDGTDVQDTKEPTASSEDESIELPVLLQDFYQRSGHLGVQKDRLHEFEVNHGHDLERRAFLLDRGDEPSPLEEKFLSDYQQRKEKILSELTAAEHDVHVLSQACKAVGLDTEARRYISSSEGRSEAEPTWSLIDPATHIPSLPFASPRSEVLAEDSLFPLQLDVQPTGSPSLFSSIQDWLSTTESLPPG